MKAAFIFKTNSLLTYLFALVLTGSLNAQSLEITAPASVAGTYAATRGAFGPEVISLSGEIRLVDDGNDLNGTSITDACDTIINDIAGTIALIDRGHCSFVGKAIRAQRAGAIGAVICNNNPTIPFFFPGLDTFDTDIPTVMISLEDCNLIKTGLGLGLAGIIQEPLSGENCENAFSILEGNHSAPALTGGSGATYFSDAFSTVWYSYTPVINGTIHVNSCNGGVDTRATLWTGSDCDNLTIATSSDDDCFATSTDSIASSLSDFVFAGQTYFISWDNVHSSEGFDWELSLGNPEMVSTTVTVDATLLDIPTDGLFIAGSFNNYLSESMTDNGDNTWSFTITNLIAGDTATYKFQNGSGNNEEDIPAECSTGMEGFRFFIPSEDTNIPSVCYESCGFCVPLNCDEPIILANEDFDTATLGEAADTVITNWEVWPGADITYSSNISDAQAISGANSVFVDGTSEDDNVYNLGDRTSGHYRIGFSVYTEEGKGYYFNIQKTHTLNGNIGENFGFQITFDPDGTYELDAGAFDAATGSWTSGQWNEVVMLVDLDNDRMSLFVQNALIYSWPVSWGTFDQDAGFVQLGGINFFPLGDDYQFYVDDITLEILSTPTGVEGEYCHNAIPLIVGTVTTPDIQPCYGGIDEEYAPGGLWYSWIAPEDGVLRLESCEQGFDTRVWIMEGDCDDWKMVGSNDDRCDIGDGSMKASTREIAVSADSSYYILWDNRWDDFGFDFEASFTAGPGTPGNLCATAIPIQPGIHTIETIDGESALVGPNILGDQAEDFPTNFVQSEWYSYTPSEDGFMKISSCDMTSIDTRLSVYTGSCDNYESLTRIVVSDDECNQQSEFQMQVSAGTTFFFEWDDKAIGDDTGHSFELELTETSLVEFVVDIYSSFVDPAGMYIGGDFNNWVPEPMTTNFDGTWSAFYNIAHGDTMQYKFLNGPEGWETNLHSQMIAWDWIQCYLIDGNRFVIGPSEDTTIREMCFNFCASCLFLNVETPLIDRVNLFPNPVANQLNVSYDFNESTDLRIKIFNNIGQEVSEVLFENAFSGTESLDVSKLFSGLYIVQLSAGNNQSTQRIVIEQ